MKISERLKDFLRCRSNMHSALNASAMSFENKASDLRSNVIAMEAQFFYLLAVDETNEAYKKLSLSDLSAFAALQGALLGEPLDWQIVFRKAQT